MPAISRFVQMLVLLTVVLLLSACGGGSSDSSSTFTVQGRVLNAALIGSTVEIFNSNGTLLAAMNTNTEGGYSVEVSQDGPYRIRATGGMLNGEEYTGTLEASCANGLECFVTPYTTVLVRLVDERGFNTGDASALVANSLGFDGDPFAEDVPVEEFDLDATREAIAGGDGLDAWVDSMVEWVADEDSGPPPGVMDPEPVDPVTYTVSTTTGPGGSLDPTNRTVAAGDTVTFTVIPDTGYRIDQVTGCGGSLAGEVYIIGAVTQSCTVSAAFSPRQYTLTYTAGSNGSLSGETEQTVSHGRSGTAVTAIPDAGYSFIEWSDASTDNPRTDTDITSDLSVEASFGQSAYTIDTDAGVGGTISPVSQTLSFGATASFAILPESGFGIGTVTGCGGSLSGNTYTTAPIIDACTVSADFTALNGLVGGKLEINRVNPGPVGGNVDVFLTATYADGLAVPGLTAESFSVQVGDRPASQPSGVTAPSEQLSIVFVMDFTTTVRESGGLEALQDATEDFVQLMQPEDWAGIVKFNIDAGASVERELAPLGAPVVDDLTGQSVLYEVIYEDYPGAGTNLNAALKLALDHIDESKTELPEGRTAIVLLGDGEDNYVEFTGQQPEPGETGAEVVAQANELNVPIFTVGVADVMTGGDGAWLDRMQNLADQTGGEFFNATEDTKEAIDQAFATTSGLLTSEYQLTFAGVDSCDPQGFTVSVDSLGLEPAYGVFTHRGCDISQ